MDINLNSNFNGNIGVRPDMQGIGGVGGAAEESPKASRTAANLTVGKGVNKKSGLPFKNTVYRKVKNSGVKYESYVEIYDDAGKRIISQGADISLNGDYSLDMPQKSFKFKAKSKC